MAPCSRIHATATDVSRPPEKASPTRSPSGRDVRTLDTSAEATRRSRAAEEQFPGLGARGNGPAVARGQIDDASHQVLVARCGAPAVVLQADAHVPAVAD